MSSRLSIAVMRACTQRLPWRTQYLRPTTAGSVSSQASVAREALRRVDGLRRGDPVAARDVELAVEHEAGRLAGLDDVDHLAGEAHLGDRRASAPLGNSCTASPAFTRPWAMRPHSVRGWLPVPSPSRATYCTGSSRSPSLRSCAVGRLSSSCSSEGPSYQAASERLRDVVAAQRRHRHDAGDVDAGLLRRRRAARRARRRRPAPGRSTASSLLTANTMLGTRSRCASSAWRRVCGSSGTGLALRVELGDVDQHHRGVAAGRGGDHVARVLLVARRVGDDELARARSRSSGRPRRS